MVRHPVALHSDVDKPCLRHPAAGTELPLPGLRGAGGVGSGEVGEGHGEEVWAGDVEELDEVGALP